MQLFSKRLTLIVLSYEQLLLLPEKRQELEQQLQLASSNLEVSVPGFMEEFVESLNEFILPGVKEHPELLPWYSHWLMVESITGRTVGGIGLAGPPDENGSVMVGYYTDEKAEGLGYATEALLCLSDWIFENVFVKSIVADTLTGNAASQRVLQKAGFVFACAVDEGWRWELKR